MAQAAQASRENRTITVDFNDETTYALIGFRGLMLKYCPRLLTHF